MRIVVTGSSGLLGKTFVPSLTQQGHRVTKLVRRKPVADAGEAFWDPQAGELDAAVFNNVDAVLHLAGESIAEGRWTAKRKMHIRESRIRSTELVVKTLCKLPRPPKILVSASAIGYYGNRGEQVLTEKSPAGDGFLADVCRDWEDATSPATANGIRVVNLRFGLILTPEGGALAKLLLPFKLGVGGKVGSGRQYWSWIAIDDVTGAMQHALVSEEVSGPVNITAPTPVTNIEFTRALGSALSRPAILPAPAFALRLALGEMADELLLASARVQPEKLLSTGYRFRFTDLDAALRHLLPR